MRAHRPRTAEVVPRAGLHPLILFVFWVTRAERQSRAREGDPLQLERTASHHGKLASSCSRLRLGALPRILVKEHPFCISRASEKWSPVHRSLVAHLGNHSLGVRRCAVDRNSKTKGHRRSVPTVTGVSHLHPVASPTSPASSSPRGRGAPHLQPASTPITC